jgi:hypothetical protein
MGQPLYLERVVWTMTRESANVSGNPNELFEIWAGFDDATASGEVLRVVEERQLGPVDCLSFYAFCYSYERAVEKLKEAL